MNVCFSLRYSSKCRQLSCRLMGERNWAVKRWVGTACLNCLLMVDVASSYSGEIMNESSFEKKTEYPGSCKSLCLWLLKSVWAARGRLHLIKDYWSGHSRNHEAKTMLKHSHSTIQNCDCLWFSTGTLFQVEMWSRSDCIREWSWQA